MADDDGGADLARTYYERIDAGDYDALADLLAPDFVHERPDRTLSGRDRFVAFMREGRPRTDTTHEVTGTFAGDDGVAVRGVLRGDDGERLFGFVDVHAVEAGRLVELETYTR